MKVIAILLSIALAGCEAPVQRQYSDGNARRVREVMWQCAMIIKGMDLATDDEKDWHYQRCLVQNNAVI